MLQVNDDKLNGSWLDGAQARFALDNDALVLPTRSALNRIVHDAPLHARFINTLSLLEHMGSHKIMATQHGAAIEQATLKHLADEAHHAYFMKRQAEKVASRPMEYAGGDLLAPAAARMYFQRLESAVVRALERPRSRCAAYLYMSMIVEFRALWFYGLYAQTLERAAHGLSLKRVLGEEQGHLADIAQRLEAGGDLRQERVDTCFARERALYARLLAAIVGAASRPRF